VAIESRLTIRIEEDTRTAFRSKVEAQGKTVTDVLLRFIKEYIDTEIPEKNNDVAHIEQRLEKLESLMEECLGELAA
jgi:antitoxin component of RelBE/YafQ-DinJ toxin-antitoxin module